MPMNPYGSCPTDLNRDDDLDVCDLITEALDSVLQDLKQQQDEHLERQQNQHGRRRSRQQQQEAAAQQARLAVGIHELEAAMQGLKKKIQQAKEYHGFNSEEEGDGEGEGCAHCECQCQWRTVDNLEDLFALGL